MPALWLDRLPLPSLPAYTVISVALVLGSFYFCLLQQRQLELQTHALVPVAEALQRRCLPHRLPFRDRTSVGHVMQLLVVYPSRQRLHEAFVQPKLMSDLLSWPTSNDFRPQTHGVVEESLVYVPQLYKHQRFISSMDSNKTIASFITDMVYDPLCLWTLINMAYCLLFVLGRSIQQSMFGELRVSEQAQLKDKFWNFVFYKFIFVFGVINVQHMDEVVLWCSWFSVLGFLHLLSQLCRDRFEYLSLSTSTLRRTHARLISLLLIILGLSCCLLTVCVRVGMAVGVNIAAFMMAECALLLVRTLHTLVRYGLHLYGENNATQRWHNNGSVGYNASVLFEVGELLVDLLHHAHMLVWYNILLSMASLIICMELRHIFFKLRLRYVTHRNHRRVVRFVEDQCTVVSSSTAAADGGDDVNEEEEEDRCAVCWDRLDTACRLSCQHSFHSWCLCQWLERDPSCPTCRCNLAHLISAGDAASVSLRRRNGTGPAADDWQAQQTGFRFVSLLSSLSVEVTHTQLVRTAVSDVADVQLSSSTQLHTMALQVQQLFPHVSVSTIMTDLRRSGGSMETTVDNILSGTVQEDSGPPPMFTSVDSPDESNVLPPITSHNELQMAPPSTTAICDSEAVDPICEDTLGDVEADDALLPGESGARFSKSASERQTILRQRKEALMRRARLRFMNSSQSQ